MTTTPTPETRILNYLADHPGMDGPTVLAACHIPTQRRASLLRSMESAGLLVWSDGPNGMRDGGWRLTDKGLVSASPLR